QLDCATSRFIEDGSLPHDSVVVGYTWQFVRRDGGPDRRFNNNRELPIAAYGFLELTSATGLNIHIQVSSQTSAAAFAEGLGRVRAKRIRERPVNYQNDRDSNRGEQLRTAFDVL